MPNPDLAAQAPLILVVEDNEDNRTMYAELLRVSGFQVETAVNGEDGLAKALLHRPAVVVMDLTMPRMSGWELTRRLKTDERTRDARIIAVTGTGVKQTADVARSAGCDAYLVKPCSPEILLAEVQSQLRAWTTNQVRRP